MNVPATMIGSAVPMPVGMASQSAPMGLSPTNWLEVLNTKLQADDQAAPLKSEPAASAAASKSVPESASAATGQTASTATVSAPANFQTGRPSGQPQTRLKRPGTADETAGAAELMAAFQFQAAPLPITYAVVSPEADTAEPTLKSTGGNLNVTDDTFATEQLISDVPQLGGQVGYGFAPGQAEQPSSPAPFDPTRPSGLSDEKVARPVIPSSRQRRDEASIPLAKSGSSEELNHPRTGLVILPLNLKRQIPTPVASALAAPSPEAAGPSPIPAPETLATTPKPALSTLISAPGLDAATDSSPAATVRGEKATESVLVTGPDQSTIPNEITPPDASVEIRGTPGAQPESTMKSGREQSEIAGWFTRGFLTRQNSTGDGRRVQAAISTGWRTKHLAGSEPGEIAALTANSPLTLGAPHNLSPDAMEVATNPSSLATHITEQAVHFKSSGLDSMQVVLKPDPKTEIHLEFVTRDGQIEAHARVASGDVQQLGHSWTHLQDSLAQQGIRLLPLAGADSFATGTGAGTQGGNTARRELPEVPGNLPASAKPSASLTASTASELTVRQLIKRLGLLDSWA